ncbi:FUSC family membrane protein [Pedobacter aquatilis]|uniref:FUSC family protein n=1 Tax=Pedobacter aquatilis TaxID=351343 RepID=UPI0025B5C7EA|nr:FUSC family membrane protein [Pedobacter aquatilis]MDN3588826.1 FUSC family membrane protein [Pedobacter aquatilis]
MDSSQQKSFGLNIIYFFLGEYFSDALRNTITIVLPIVIFYWLKQPELASGIGVGALLVSLTDFPDNKFNKFRTALYGIVVFFLTTIIISLSLSSTLLLATVMTLAAFGFSMFAVYGNRISIIGTMALVVCCFVMGLHPKNPVNFSFYMLIGGVWYYLISLLQILVFPYRSLNHAIFECIMSSAVFLKAKASNYDVQIPFDASQKEIIKLHIKVNQKHELIRNLLLTDRQAMSPDNKNGQILLGRALLLIDLYEQLNAVHYDYGLVREVLKKSSLDLMTRLLNLLAFELEDLARNVHTVKSDFAGYSNHKYNNLIDLIRIEEENASPNQKDILSQFVANTDAVVHILELIRTHTTARNLQAENLGIMPNYPAFVTVDKSTLKHHLSFKSPFFRFSIRLALCFLFGFLLISQLSLSKYSYWLFLTLVIVARPKFTVTWRRNLQRLSGSLGGIIVGLALIYFIKNPAILLSLSVFLLLGFFSFNRINYTISVLFITPAVILTLGSYHGHFDHIIQERILFTILGCLIAVLASILFPIWDSKQLRDKINQAINFTKTYLLSTADISEIENKETLLRMSRKDANMSLSALSEGIDSASQEPFRKRGDLNSFYNIQLIIYQINALITSLNIFDKGISIYEQEIISRILENLNVNDDVKANKKLDTDDVELYQPKPIPKKKLEHILLLSEKFKVSCIGLLVK